MNNKVKRKFVEICGNLELFSEPIGVSRNRFASFEKTASSEGICGSLMVHLRDGTALIRETAGSVLFRS